MEFALASAIGILTAAGIYLLLRARSFDVILGLTLLSYATNLLIFSAGRLRPGMPPILREGVPATLANHADPLPQALVLTAIVIGFAMTAVSIVIAIRNRGDSDSDHVDAGTGLDYTRLVPLDTDREETAEDMEACATAPAAGENGKAGGRE
ncbi:Na+/H+ antiporter subunit C [Lysobacter pythonis]|uniref:Na+/H+ antiporter subunit C n=1 Tax=Solilutibacter pythonis TaxID=2483112 RepID=A0A3M2I2F0_9GAMM|nr:Na+/H+ antiporter subunit C [Lysobacter pythonis]